MKVIEATDHPNLHIFYTQMNDTIKDEYLWQSSVSVVIFDHCKFVVCHASVANTKHVLGLASPLVKLNFPNLSAEFVRKACLGFCSIVLGIASLLDLLHLILTFFIVISAAKEKSAGRDGIFFAPSSLQSWSLLTNAWCSKSWSLKDSPSLYLASISSELSRLLVCMDDDAARWYIFVLIELYRPEEILFLREEDVELKFGDTSEEEGFW